MTLENFKKDLENLKAAGKFEELEAIKVGLERGNKDGLVDKERLAFFEAPKVEKNKKSE